MSVKVEFRVGEKDGKQLLRSIYTDLVNLPDPVYLGLTVSIFNYDDVTLYMRVDGSGPGWTFTSNDFGAVGSGGSIRRNIDNFGTRAKPGAALTQTVTVRLRAYTDAAYTILKWTYERVIDMVFLKSDDGSWTQDVLNNFDNGTVQGWAFANEGEAQYTGYPTLTVVTDFVLSPPYSLKLTQRLWIYDSYKEGRVQIYKAFTTPDRNNVFGIADLRITVGTYAWSKYIEARNQGVATLIFLGRGYDTVKSSYLPHGKWMRLVFPLPKNTALTVGIAFDWLARNTGDQKPLSYMWMDDFRIISKD